MPKPLTPRLAELKEEIEGYARAYGLEFFDQIFEILSYDEMNMVAAYGGFPKRYPHWRYGMEYERLAKGYEYGLSKIYEMVINNDPCYAYLLESNAEVDQKTVMAHVFGHNDFFKNNFYFQHTNRKMVDEMANHATRVRRLIDRLGIEKVEAFVDTCLSVENLIDHHSPYIKRRASKWEREQQQEERDQEREDDGRAVHKLKVERSYMDHYINPKEFLDQQRQKADEAKAQEKRFPERPERDVLLFLLEHAPLERWERDVLSIVREEAYYFAPQGQTKVLNEGWACVAGDTLVFTEEGVLPMADVVEAMPGVSDGERVRRVYDRNVIPNRRRITVRTRRGFTLTGSDNHRVLLPDGERWCRLDALAVGDHVRIGGGAGVWAAQAPCIDWTPPSRVSLQDVAEEAGVSLWTVLRHRAGRNIRQAGAVATALEAYDTDENQALPMSMRKRAPIRIPDRMSEELGAFLGYLVGDGHISRVKRQLGLTTGDEEQATRFAQLASRLFDVRPLLKQDGGRMRVLVHSETLADFLTDHVGLTHGPSARQKQVPALVLRSPASVVRAFLRALFDCDGYAGPAGAILSTASEALSRQVQLLLLNDGILSRRRQQKDECWHVHVTGASAARFADRIGFDLSRKQDRLKRYVTDRRWFLSERWDDEIVSVEADHGDVYDISVEETHRYAAAGFVNHNSFWHSKIMTERAVRDHEIIDYASAHAGVVSTSGKQLNPYKLGIELLRDIEERWNKGRFGKEFDECDDMASRRAWDRNLGLGREKIFEVRRLYNDVTFIDTFLTPEFCVDQKFFVYEFNEKGNRWEIVDKQFRAVKQKLLSMLTNFGQPIIEVVDGNYRNRGELLLMHRHEGVDLKHDHALDTLRNLQAIWRRPVHIHTKVEEKGVLLSFDGDSHAERHVEEP
jgi:stage V sporulation protein R